MARRCHVGISCHQERRHLEAANVLGVVIVLGHGLADLVQQPWEVLRVRRDSLIELPHRRVLQEFGGGRVHLSLLGEHLGRNRVAPGVCRGHDEPTDLVRVFHCREECDSAAEGVTDNVGLVQLQMVDERGDVVGHEPDVDRPINVSRTTVSLKVDDNHLVLLRELGEGRSEHLARSKPSVEQDQRLASPVGLEVEIDAVDLGVLPDTLLFRCPISGRHAGLLS